ncbi:hypothetical protein RCL_jg20530.t1 [Rhizophagus clarus]|uniref:Uncharacterized protein n=1 Tax=Rhizophagus clarus TaxID=94130 RepID=A0A8H3LQQ2_9GLOM|nr:hypothetical protein RCL_jg20530.t1 [Rhizophagus clarus]
MMFGKWHVKTRIDCSDQRIQQHHERESFHNAATCNRTTNPQDNVLGEFSCGIGLCRSGQWKSIALKHFLAFANSMQSNANETPSILGHRTSSVSACNRISVSLIAVFSLKLRNLIIKKTIISEEHKIPQNDVR